ncbi:MAG TPA: hypothetical protein VG367_07350 [Mucilaginibacter sp.]|jgi:hypothetical protein|nr:hypothetical protein [Mucilaginibacter sp.]
MRSFLITIAFLVLELSAFAQAIKIISLKELDYTDTSKDKTITSRFDHYLVHGYTENKASIAYIDRFIKQIPATNFKKYTRYTITIFKESPETNGITISNYKKTEAIPFYGKNDLILEYCWENGVYLARHKYKNDKLIESKFADNHLRIKPLSIDSSQCDFLKNLKFKNGRDTITIKAVLGDIVEAPPRVSFKNKPRPTIYKYKFSSYLSFRPENCIGEYSAALLDNAFDNKILTYSNRGITVFITCIVFNQSFDNVIGHDCIVIKVASAIQTPIVIPNRCTFLSNLHFKNGADTIVIKAMFHAVYKPGIGLIVSDLGKSNLLKTNEYNYGIAFQVPGCDEKLVAPYHFKTATEKNLLEKQPEDTPIYLTCVAFQKYYSYGLPFFIIEKFKIGEH